MAFLKQIKAKKWNGQDFNWAHAKMDGWRITFHKKANGVIQAFGKDHRPHLEMIKRFPGLKEHPTYLAIAANAPMNSIFDCEAYVPGVKATSVPTYLKSDVKGLTIKCFAVPMFRNQNIFDEALPRVAQICGECGVPFIETIFTYSQLFNDRDGYDHDEFRTDMYILARTLKVEGWVLKCANYDGWYKVKEQKTMDVVISSINLGTPNTANEGIIGSLNCSVIDEKKEEWFEVASVSGMTDEQRQELTALHEKDQLIHKVAEIQYQDVGSKGRLRHPSFIRLRDDGKRVSDCFYHSQL